MATSQFRNLDTDTSLGGASSSDYVVASQKAIKAYADTKQPTLTAGTGIDITGNTISANNIVWVTYNSTTFADIKTAWDAGKVVMCKKDNQEFLCTNYISGGTQFFYFTCVETYSTTRYLRVSSADAWITGSQSNQAYISDLATIRSGAAAGATAVQPGDLATVATSGDYDDLLNKPTIPTVNNPTITITQGGVTKGSFTLNQASGDTIALDAGGGGGSYTAGDGIDITSNVITATGTKNKNTAAGATNPVYDWVGTLAEYTTQAVATNHPDWVCYITDDCEATAYEAYTQSQCNNLFVQKAHEVIEFQAPTAQNNYTWYRKYADGWVEQGGQSQNGSIAFPVEMADINYFVGAAQIRSGSSTATYYSAYKFVNLSTTGMDLMSGQSENPVISWEVKGMAA